jgi:hypothetical protein
VLPFDELFPFALFTLDGEEDQVVYACNGVIVGICVFEHVPLLITDSPTQLITDSPTPNPVEISLPSKTPVTPSPPSASASASFSPAPA